MLNTLNTRSVMALPAIIFYGTPGLEAQIFQTYMASSGYQVQMVTTRDGAFASVAGSASAIVVIAIDKPPQELTALAQEIRARKQVPANHIFILSGEQSFDTGLPSVDVIPRPFRLSEVIARIQAITRRKF